MCVYLVITGFDLGKLDGGWRRVRARLEKQIIVESTETANIKLYSVLSDGVCLHIQAN